MATNRADHAKAAAALKEAQEAAHKNLQENSGRDQARFEHDVDVAEKAANRA
jgi:hypothetical protein